MTLIAHHRVTEDLQQYSPGGTTQVFITPCNNADDAAHRRSPASARPLLLGPHALGDGQPMLSCTLLCQNRSPQTFRSIDTRCAVTHCNVRVALAYYHLRKRCTVLERDGTISLILTQVDLVRNNAQHAVLLDTLLHAVHPVAHVEKRLFTRHVVHYHHAICLAEVLLGDRAEAAQK